MMSYVPLAHAASCLHTPTERRKLLKGVGGLVLGQAAFAGAATPESAAAPRAQAATPATGAQPDTLAIDCLLEPDAALVATADAINARLRENYPPGYSLDATHAPHVSLAQRFVRADAFDELTAAVSSALAAERPVGWPLQATGYDYAMWAGVALTVLLIERTPDLERLQQAVLAALAPYTVAEGTAAAFVTSPGAPDINANTIDYVKTFVPDASGTHFTPHVTVGVANEAFVQQLKAEPFADVTGHVANVAIYHLGDFGVAAQRLWQWAPPSA